MRFCTKRHDNGTWHALRLEPDPQEVQNLRKVEHGQESTQGEEREPEVGLVDVCSVDRCGQLYG